MPRARKVDQALRELRRSDSRFQIFMKHNGSHREIYHPNVSGVARAYIIPYHKGKDLKPCYLKDIINRFDLARDFFG